MRYIMKPPNPLSLSLSLSKIEFISPNFQEKFKDLFFDKNMATNPPNSNTRYRIKPKGKCITIIRGM
jgi:Leucine-rich repeat (LRR) protein